MGVPGNANPLLLVSAAAAAPTGYEITRSLRFNSGDSAYLNRTPSSAGNQTTWTWSGWVKRSAFDTTNNLFVAGTSAFANIRFANQNIDFTAYNGSSYVGRKVTSAVYRDPSAWYHIVCVFDTTNATAADRMRVYVNGVREESFSTSTDPTQNVTSVINSTIQHRIGTFDGSTEFFNGYLADVHFIDGQALAATDFGEFDDNNVWQPIAYAGTYGTNGFHLDFSDATSTTTLGEDSSGNNNDWALNNFVANSTSTGFKPVLYTGDGASSRTISGLGFSPDLVWLKDRTNTGDDWSHRLHNSVAGADVSLSSNSTAGERDSSAQAGGGLEAFTSDGFTLQAGTSNNNNANKLNASYVAWCWDAGSSTVSNTDGTITSSVRANIDLGFSIVTYTGTGSAGDSIGHGLGVSPAMVIHKRRDTTGRWATLHTSLGSNGYLFLDGTDAAGTATNIFNPSSSTLTLTDATNINGSSGTYVAYCFAPKPGASAFGSYTGNGSSTGPVITTGFKPAFFMVKRTDNVGHWIMVDTARGPETSNNVTLRANVSDAENTTYGTYDFLANSFQIKTTDIGANASGGTYIYMAFASAEDAAEVDSLLDSPTEANVDSDTGAGGEVSGNYATFLGTPSASVASNFTRTNGNLDASGSNANQLPLPASIFPSSGKWYCELVRTSGSGARLGVVNTDGLTEGLGNGSNGWCFLDDGRIFHNSSASSYGSAISTGDIFMIALDIDAGKVWYGSNGSWFASGDPGAGSNPSQTFTAGQSMTFAVATGAACAFTANFGQRPFAYNSNRTGYQPLTTALLDDPTIADGSTAMDVALYTGDGSATRAVSGLNFSPEFVWIKDRSNARNHVLTDIVRGATKTLHSDLTASEQTYATALKSFDSTGFTVGNGSIVNNLNETYVAWTWDGGSSTVSNTDGSITSSVRANASAGFSIVSYTGNASDASNTIGHGLGVEPIMIIYKNRTSADGWIVYFKGITPLNNNLQLDNDGGVTTYNYSIGQYSNYFGDPSGFSSSTFSISAGSSYINRSGENFVAYCWAPVEGYSAFGSYTGNGSSDGPFVYTGFKPSFLLFKSATQSSHWVIYDYKRNTYNQVDLQLASNLANGESNESRPVDFLSNGFKIRFSTYLNVSGQTYIYAAFAEHPFKTARAR